MTPGQHIGTGSTAVALLSALAILASVASPALSCSVFTLTSDETTVLGQNLDLDAPFPGCVVVNPRGVEKAVLPWQGTGPVPFEGEVPTWTSQYGSVTFTCWGRDFIEGGMNEAGLTIDQANLTATYPPVDARPGVSPAQWMQYQLDNFSLVEEVLAHIDDLRLDGEEWHFLVADAGGDCDIIEFPDGAALVYSGDDVDVPAMTNTSHSRALSHLAMEAAFGGDGNIASGSDSYGRFVRMAALIDDYAPERDGAASEYAFKVLEEVRADDTLRTVVYDSGSSRVSWKTPGNPDIRWLDLATLALDEDSVVVMLDVESDGSGDASALLRDYTEEANRLIVDGTKGSMLRVSGVAAALDSLGLTIDKTIDHIVGHPTLIGGPR